MGSHQITFDVVPRGGKEGIHIERAHHGTEQLPSLSPIHVFHSIISFISSLLSSVPFNIIFKKKENIQGTEVSKEESGKRTANAFVRLPSYRDNTSLTPFHHN